MLTTRLRMFLQTSTALYFMALSLSVILILLADEARAVTQEIRSTSGLEAGDLLHAAEIFEGRVISAQGFRESGGLILTRYQFLIRNRLKGDAEKIIELVEYGGTVGNESMSVSHTASFSEGQEYLVFAAPDLTGRLRTVGGTAGTLLIIGDQHGNRRVRLISGHPLVEVVGPGPLFREVDDLTNRIHSAVQEVGR